MESETGRPIALIDDDAFYNARYYVSPSGNRLMVSTASDRQPVELTEYDATTFLPVRTLITACDMKVGSPVRIFPVEGESRWVMLSDTGRLCTVSDPN